MQTHRNAKLGLSGRFALVQAREAGLSVREVARRFSVSPATVSRWSCRWRRASAEERATLGCLFDRSSRPRRMPRLLPALEQRQICAARRRTGWGPRLLTVATGRPHSTISKVLKRHGLSRPERAAREPVRRYEWPCPGDLLHSDWTLYARFDRPGHAVTGDRSKTAAEKKARLGYQFAHAIVDDHSRLGYAELLADCRAATVTAFTARALRFFAAHGIEAKRVMTDNHWS
jgi:transposase